MRDLMARGGDVDRIDAGAVGKDIRAAWRKLALARENPFLTPEWLDAWRAAAGEEPRVLGFSVDGELRGVLPLVSAAARGRRELRFPGAANGDWFGAACLPADEEAAIAAWLAHLRGEAGGWDVLRLDRVEGAAAWRAGIEGAWGPRAGREPRAADVLPFIDLGEGYDGWLASRSRNFRSQLSRRRKKAAKEHEVEYRDTPAAAELEEAMEGLFRLHDERRVDAGGAGRLDAVARAAYLAFARASLEAGWLRMHSVVIDGELAAAWYGWRLGERYCYGISGFDPRWGGLAVGTLLLAHTIERAAAEGAPVYDLLWGDETYKARYETGRRTVETVAVAAGARGRAALAAEAGARRLAERLPDGVAARLRRLRGRGGEA